jgi:hypothetical protein
MAGVSVPSRRTFADVPSVQKTSPVSGCATAATPEPANATFTENSGVSAAKLRVPQSGSTSQVRAA